MVDARDFILLGSLDFAKLYDGPDFFFLFSEMMMLVDGKLRLGK